MKWLIKMMSKANKKRAGFTLIELMVVVIVVGILAAAAVPIYKFAMNRAYASEAKATMGTIRASELVYAAENDTNNDPTDDYLIASSLSSPSILTTLGVDTSTNTWWHAAPETTTTCVFGFSTGTAVMGYCTKLPKTLTALNYHIYVKGTSGVIDEIEMAMDITTGTWYHYWP